MGSRDPTRRAMGRGLAAAAFAALARPALGAASVPEAATILAPGPDGGTIGQLAHDAAATLARGLVQATALRVTVLGGPDGITAANRFAASSGRDGQMLLLMPGAAVHAQLVGDPRVRFEPRHWPAICGNVQPCILAGRGPLRLDAAAQRAAQPIRLALPGPAAPEAAGLLALDLLGLPAVPVFAPSQTAIHAAIRDGAADAMLLAGASLEQRAASLGLTPWCAFDSATQARDAALPDVPALGELLPDPPRPDLLIAARAAAAALRGHAVLVLPALTSANVVALWRNAGQHWPDEAPAEQEAGTRRIAAGPATVLMTTLCPAPDVALAYQVWLLRRLNFQSA